MHDLKWNLIKYMFIFSWNILAFFSISYECKLTTVTKYATKEGKDNLLFHPCGFPDSRFGTTLREYISSLHKNQLTLCHKQKESLNRNCKANK